MRGGGHAGSLRARRPAAESYGSARLPYTVWVNSFPLTVRSSTTSICHGPGTGSRVYRLAVATGVPFDVVAVATSLPLGCTRKKVNPLSALASAVWNLTLRYLRPVGRLTS